MKITGEKQAGQTVSTSQRESFPREDAMPKDSYIDSAMEARAQATSLLAKVTRKGKAPKKVMKLEAVEVHGRIQKPQAFFIMRRATLNVEEIEKPEEFLDRLIQAVEEEPF